MFNYFEHIFEFVQFWGGCSLGFLWRNVLSLGREHFTTGLAWPG